MRQNKLLILLSLTISLALSAVSIRYGSVLSESDKDSKSSIIVVGDIMLGRSVNTNISRFKNAAWPFVHVSDITKNVDITIGNLESPLVPNCPLTNTGMIFCGEASNTLGLKSAGFDFVSFANNHATNYGNSGITNTLEALSTYGVTALTPNNPVYTTLGPNTLALIAFDDVSRPVEQSTLKSSISSLQGDADLILVYFHWGSEYQTKSNVRQQALAYAAIDAGADIIIGAHPHVIQESEWYQGKPIYYSLGNFVFDQEWSDATKRGLAVRINFEGSTITSIEELSVLIENYGQPKWLNANVSKNAL